MKKLPAVLLAFVFCQTVFSQSFSNGIGVVTFVQGAPGYSSFAAGGFTYTPRFNFFEMENSSVSVALPMSIAASGSYRYSTYGDESNSIGVILNIPLIFNYNIGAGSTKTTSQRFGFFIGGGAGYHLSARDYVDGYDGSENTENVHGFGPAGDIGVRFGVGRRSKNIELRCGYMKTLDVTKTNVGSLAGLFNF